MKVLERIENEMRLWTEYYNNEEMFVNDILLPILAHIPAEEREERVKKAIDLQLKSESLDKMYDLIASELDNLYDVSFNKEDALNNILSLIFNQMDDESYNKTMVFMNEALSVLDAPLDMERVIINVDKSVNARHNIKIECMISLRTLTAVKQWIEEEEKDSNECEVSQNEEGN